MGEASLNVSMKKQHEKNIRDIDASQAKAQKRVEDSDAQIRQIEEKLAATGRQSQQQNSAIADENTKIIKALDEKQAMDRQLSEYKKKQEIIEAEIKIITGIYDPKA